MKPQRFPKVSLRKLSHTQIRTVLQRIVDHCESSATITPIMRLLIKDILNQLVFLDKILLREEKCAHTKAINELDALRDRAYRLLVKKIRGTQEEFDMTIVDAGAPLMPIIEKFTAKITEKSYTEETTLMNLALSEFRKPEYETNFATLTMLVDLERVETFESQFETLWGERSEDESAEEKLPLMRAVRYELDHKGKLLLQNCEYLFEKKHASMHESLFNKISDELTKVGSTVKMRETIKENAEN